MLQRWKRSPTTHEERLADQFEFCPALAALLRTSGVVGKSGKVFNNLGALSSINTLVTLRNLYLDLKPRRTLEVGLCFGASALLFTGLHRESGNLTNRQHVALDPFQFSVWDDAGLLQVERAGLASFLDFRSTYSCLELPRLLQDGTRFDFIYVDGSHIFEDVFVDAFYSCRLLVDDGVIAFDDCSATDVAKVLRFLRTNLSESLAELDLTQYRQEGQRGLTYRAARLLGKVQLTAFRKIGSPVREWNAPFSDF